MIEAWKKQFSLKQLSLHHDKPLMFVTSQWQKVLKPHPIYLIYRSIIALIFFITLVISVIDLKHLHAAAAYKAKWLIYLTNWGYTICTVQAVLAAIILSVCVISPRYQDNIIKLYKVYWMANITATVIAFGITTLYWSLIYDEKVMDLDVMNIFVHVINSVIMMLDLFIVSHPLRLLHCCYPILFGMCYVTFSIIFYAAGGISKEGHRYIYTILNWDKPGKTTIICLAVTGFIVVVHVFTWGMYKLRLCLYMKIFGDEFEGSKEDEVISKSYYVNEGLANDNV